MQPLPGREVSMHTCIPEPHSAAHATLLVRRPAPAPPGPSRCTQANRTLRKRSSARGGAPAAPRCGLPAPAAPAWAAPCMQCINAMKGALLKVAYLGKEAWRTALGAAGGSSSTCTRSGRLASWRTRTSVRCARALTPAAPACRQRTRYRPAALPGRRRRKCRRCRGLVRRPPQVRCPPQPRQPQSHPNRTLHGKRL